MKLAQEPSVVAVAVAAEAAVPVVVVAVAAVAAEAALAAVVATNNQKTRDGHQTYVDSRLSRKRQHENKSKVSYIASLLAVRYGSCAIDLQGCCVRRGIV